ncbi:hypothetical protein NQ315_009578 [Exocentrus adspersus]|uniref:Protein rolling stone n=1 Tax=Exocentrus adspersus TaxID=1586481 RepID=A0AAV8WHW8_9CUCU|nr:hypothetical protein NQ315_009578 [Exocentrus adspersus]
MGPQDVDKEDTSDAETGKGGFKEHFSFKKLKLVHDAPILFVVSQWQADKTKPGILYLIYRTIIVGFLLTTWAMSLNTPKYPIFLTNWGYTLATAQSVLGFILSYGTVISLKFNYPKAHDIFLKLYPIYWILHEIALSFAFMITIIFWTVLYNGTFFTATNFFVHGSNSIVLFIDLWIIAHPIHIPHYLYLFIFGQIYILFTVAYYYLDTNTGGSGIIYFILDWNRPFQTILMDLAISFLVLLLHVTSFGIHQIKILTHARMCTRNTSQSTQNLTV